MTDPKPFEMGEIPEARLVVHTSVADDIWQDVRYAAAAGGVVALTDLTDVLEPTLQHYIWWPVAAAAFRIGVNWLRGFAHKPDAAE